MNYRVRYTAGLVMAFKLLEAADETRRRSTRPTPSPSSERVLRAGSPDLHVEIEDLLAEGDQVIAWIRMTGKQTGSRGPIPPTGRAVDFHHAQGFRLRDGRIVGTYDIQWMWLKMAG